MTTGGIAGLAGGVAGGVLGVAGGVIGSYFSIKKTNGPMERSFMIKSAAACWIAIGIFLGLLLGLPGQGQPFMWIPCSILPPLGIIFVNRKQPAIGKQESQDNPARPPAAPGR